MDPGAAPLSEEPDAVLVRRVLVWAGRHGRLPCARGAPGGIRAQPTAGVQDVQPRAQSGRSATEEAGSSQTQGTTFGVKFGPLAPVQQAVSSVLAHCPGS